MRRLRRWMLLLALNPHTGLAGDNWFGSENAENARVSAGVQSAHQAYLEKRWSDMTTAMRGVLADTNATPAARDNVLSLLNKAYSDGVKNIPVDWRLPDGVRDLKISVRRKNKSDGISYNLLVKADLDKGVELAQLRLAKFPNEVIADKANGIGEWDDSPETYGHQVSGSTDNREHPAEEGLYLIDLTLGNGVRTQGWVILSNMVASESPVVNAPTAHELIKTAHPTFRWNDFRSPELQPNETRILAVHLRAAKTLNNPLWGFYEVNPSITEVTLREGVGEGATALKSGHYYGVIIYLEQHRFGPVKLRRESATIVPFEVLTP